MSYPLPVTYAIDPNWIFSQVKTESGCLGEIVSFFLILTGPKEKDTVNYSEEVCYTPVGSIDNTGPLNISVPSVEDFFTDLSKTSILLKVRVEKSDDGKLESWAMVRGGRGVDNQAGGVANPPVVPSVSVCNDFFDSCMRKITLEISGTRTG